MEAIYKITGLSYLSQSIAKNTTHSQSQDILGKLNIEKTPFVKNITNSFNLIEKQTNVDTVTLVFISLNLSPIHLYKQKSLVFRIGN